MSIGIYAITSFDSEEIFAKAIYVMSVKNSRILTYSFFIFRTFHASTHWANRFLLHKNL